MNADAIRADYALRINAAWLRDAERDKLAAAGLDAACVRAVTDICGTPIRPMTVEDFLCLTLAGNAHLCAIAPPEDDVQRIKFWARHSFVLLWRLFPGYQPDAKLEEAFMSERIDRAPLDGVMDGISDFLRETFAYSRFEDAPTTATQHTAPPPAIGVSFFIHWQHRVCSAYHWSSEQFRAVPLKELFQILRMLDAEARLKAGKRRRPPAVAREADRLWAEMLTQINALRGPAK